MVHELMAAGVDVNIVLWLLAGFAAICIILITILGLKLSRVRVGYAGIVFTMIMLLLIAVACITGICALLTG